MKKRTRIIALFLAGLMLFGLVASIFTGLM